MAIAVNKKVRDKASTAEIIPLESAVNIPLAKMLKPTKSSASEQIRLPPGRRQGFQAAQRRTPEAL